MDGRPLHPDDRGAGWAPSSKRGERARELRGFKRRDVVPRRLYSTWHLPRAANTAVSAESGGLAQRETPLCIHNETDAGLLNLPRLTALRRLFIDITTVTDATLAQLSRLRSLKELAFGGETGSDAGMAHRRALRHEHHGPCSVQSTLSAAVCEFIAGIETRPEDEARRIVRSGSARRRRSTAWSLTGDFPRPNNFRFFIPAK